MTRIFIISDTHLYHTKMQQYCSRPSNFNELLFKGLEVVGENDILIHLGDICIGHDEVAHSTFNQIVKCRKILVKGNHDVKSNTWYLEHGWDFVCESFKDRYFGKEILFSHHPIGKDVCKYDINIHGHCHTSKRLKEYEPTMNEDQILIAVEKTNYKPLLLDTIIKLHDKNKKDVYKLI